MLSVMRASILVFVVVAAGASLTTPSVLGKPKKATEALVSVTFEAHNEAIEGSIYGDANLVSVTIDKVGVQYHAKGTDKPEIIPWAEVSGWRANNFTSYSPSRASNGDFGIGIYRNQVYFSFRTRNGRDYLAAVKALRAFAPEKERPGE